MSLLERLRRQRTAGEPTAAAPPPAAADAPRPGPGVREVLGAYPLRLPVGIARGEDKPPLRLVWLRAMRGENQLTAGLLPLIIGTEDTEEMKAQAEEWRVSAEAVACECLVSPRAVPAGNDAAPGEVAVDSLTDEDLERIFTSAVNVTHTMFYGLDRGAPIPEDQIDRQQEVSALYVRLCRAFPALHPIRDLRFGNPDDIRWMCGMLEGAESWEKAHAPKKDEPTGRGEV